MNRRKFVKLPPEKAPEMFSLVLERMQWMDEKGIEHWNVVEYDKLYPLSYYEENAETVSLLRSRTKTESRSVPPSCSSTMTGGRTMLPRSMSTTSPRSWVSATRERSFCAARGSTPWAKARHIFVSIRQRTAQRSQSTTKASASSTWELAKTAHIRAFSVKKS